MGFLKGSISLSRFVITDKEKAANISAEEFDQQIKAFAFRKFFPKEAEKSVGWTCIEDVLDTNFSFARNSYGNYRLFSLRIDRRNIPAALTKIRTLEAEQKFLEENKIPKLYRDQRQSIKEAVRLELLEETNPVPSFFEACWSNGTGTVLFTNLAPKTVQEFQDLFRETFGLSLQPLLPWDPEALLAKDISPAFIGREFLTWLWFKSEERAGIISMAEDEEIEIQFTRKMTFESGEGEYTASIVSKGQHADHKEGKEALRRGKRLKEARISLGHDSAKWEFTFKGDTFRFQSMKLPVPTNMDDEEDDKSGQTLERIYLIETALKVMDDLFIMFMDKRVSGDWPHVVSEIEKWIEEK